MLTPAEIAAVVTAVIRPFAFAVMTGTTDADPNVPTFEFTVASVVATAPTVVVISPVSAGIRGDE